MLQRGDHVPHFEIRDVQGKTISYSTIWQRRNLVLVVLPPSDSDSTARYTSELVEAAAAFGPNTTLVITRDALPGLSAGAVVVADKWGEIIYVCDKYPVADLPSPRDLLDWISYVETKCPECEGEAR